jgi:hypothetical protein
MPLHQPMAPGPTNFNPANFASHLVNVNTPLPITPAPFPGAPMPFANFPAPLPNTPTPFPGTPAPFANFPAQFPSAPAQFPNAPFFNPLAPFPDIPGQFANFLPPHPINANSVVFPDIIDGFQEAPDPVAQDQSGQPDVSGIDFNFSEFFNIAEDGSGAAEDGPGAAEDGATGVVSTGGMEIEDAEGDRGEEEGQEAQGVAHLYNHRSLDTASAS